MRAVKISWLKSPMLTAFAIGMLLSYGLVATNSATAQQPADISTSERKVQDFIKMLDDPDIRAFLTAKSAEASEVADEPVGLQLSDFEARYRNHLVSLKSAIPRIPSELSNAAKVIATDVNAGRPGKGLAIVAILIALGYAAEWLFRRALRGVRGERQSLGSARSEAPNQAIRIVSEVISLAVFSIVSVGLFLVFDWPPLLRKMVLTYLFVFILFRIAIAIGRLLLSPDENADRTLQRSPLRLVPITNAQARFWHQRIKLAAGYFLFSWATVSVMPELEFSAEVVRLFAYLFGLGLLAIGIEIVWRRPPVTTAGARAARWLLTAYLVLLWLVWVVGMYGLLWIGIYVLLLPTVVSGAGHVAQALTGGDHSGTTLSRSLLNVLIVRGARALVIAAAVGWLATVWRFSPAAASGNEMMERLVAGLLNGVIVLLVADLLWNLAKVYIERKLDASAPSDTESPELAARRSRLRTLLPIFRNSLAVLIIVITVLTILSGLGVQIAPLIAGAGIFGVAIGFGSQTLVKDVLSGVFYMMDDAFRVGEYIESGSYKGTVESFSLRSVRLRHHRGPVFTVPFGDLGAVQNMSRDWAIDKFKIRVPFDTNVAKVKKLLKGIGAELLADPEVAPQIIETVKMKGVEQFGDFGMELSFSFMSKPGYQSVVRRRAYTMIQQSFAANGIHFAQPTVQVGGDDKQAATAAANIISLAQQKAAQTRTE
ncbi:mechanosensitive ion channel family protein [Mesorhizobium sp. YR577]|uniref:mechanosensitive ion channel family protein n=1 Tax=Mesorhizobium sp. YR577 TaxID=1884373 RepID=UPI0008E983B1|nr:mechanosensitive ion channel family protein [Mesorhizobium sp. YR577]SFU21277.1 Small-conductance mechanosensitive channel [Mesorhizobium sp. YR577]